MLHSIDSDSRRPRRALALCAVLLLAGGCFEPPIAERLVVRFLPNGAVVVTAHVAVSEPEGENPALERRLAETRQALLGGWDPWTRRFAALEPAAEKFTWEKRLGELRTAVHAAVATEPERLGAFFGDTPVAVSYAARDGVAELTLMPGPADRATRRQRKEIERALADWSERVAAYLAAGGDLYRYLDEHPGRARDCLGAVLDDLLSDEDRASLGELSEEEGRHVERLQTAMAEVWDVLLVPKGADHSLDEVSRLVYDPFPAPLTVALPADPLDGEGFEPDADGNLAVPSRSLWSALRGLEERWLSPDPVVLYVTAGGRSRRSPLDLDGLLREKRRAEPAPSAAEVKKAIEERLAPASVYRVTWPLDPKAAEAEDEAPFKWED